MRDAIHIFNMICNVPIKQLYWVDKSKVIKHKIIINNTNIQIFKQIKDPQLYVCKPIIKTKGAKPSQV